MGFFLAFVILATAVAQPFDEEPASQPASQGLRFKTTQDEVKAQRRFKKQSKKVKKQNKKVNETVMAGRRLSFLCSDGCSRSSNVQNDGDCDCWDCADESLTGWTCSSCGGCPTSCGSFTSCGASPSPSFSWSPSPSPSLWSPSPSPSSWLSSSSSSSSWLSSSSSTSSCTNPNWSSYSDEFGVHSGAAIYSPIIISIIFIIALSLPICCGVGKEAIQKNNGTMAKAIGGLVIVLSILFIFCPLMGASSACRAMTDDICSTCSGCDSDAIYGLCTAFWTIALYLTGGLAVIAFAVALGILGCCMCCLCCKLKPNPNAQAGNVQLQVVQPQVVIGSPAVVSGQRE